MLHISTVFFSPLFGRGHKAPRIQGYFKSFNESNISSKFYGLPSEKKDFFDIPSVGELYDYRGCGRMSNIGKYCGNFVGKSSFGRYLGTNCIARKSIKDGSLIDTKLVFTQPYFYPLVRLAKRKGLPVLLEVDSSHPLDWWDILRSRERKNKISKFHSDPWNFYPYVNNTLKSIEVADKVIVFSDYAEESFLKRGFPKNRLEKLRPPLNLPVVNVKNKSTYPKFIFVSNHAIRKGLDITLGAYQEYIKRGGRGELYVCGKKSPSFDEIFVNFENTPRLHYLGNIDVQKFFLAERCVLINPSLAEGRPRTTLEAMSVGNPVIASYAGSADVVENGKTGWLISPEIGDLCDSMIDVDNKWDDNLESFIANVSLKMKQENMHSSYYSDVSNLILELASDSKFSKF